MSDAALRHELPLAPAQLPTPEPQPAVTGRWGRLLRLHGLRWAWLCNDAASRAAKRALDVGGALALSLALSPILLGVAVAILLLEGGPILFWQDRVGRHGRVFAFPKFRSMAVDAEARLAELAAANHNPGSITFKMADDPRVTRLGRLIRKASIDELPQLWCVLKGEMSLVGPRPPLPREVMRYRIAERRRLDVVPGLTCIWQVSGRSDVPFDRQVLMDVEYIERRSLALDVSLLARTLPAVINGRGAY